MHECLTIPDDDEGDHRWSFSSSDPVLLSESGIPIHWHKNFLSNFCSGNYSPEIDEIHQIITLISGNRGYYGLITG